MHIKFVNLKGAMLQIYKNQIVLHLARFKSLICKLLQRDIFYKLNRFCFADNERIKAVRQGNLAFCKVDFERFCEFGNFLRRDIKNRLKAAATFHLDEMQDIIFTRDNVNLPVARVKIALQHFKTE